MSQKQKPHHNKPAAGEENTTDETSQENPEKWTLRFRDLPDVAGRRPVVSRLIADYQLTTNDPLGFMSVLDYSYVRSPLMSTSSSPSPSNPPLLQSKPLPPLLIPVYPY